MSQAPKTRSSRPASGTKSAIRGTRFSVRLPRRMVPIWVSEPMGLPSPRRTASTPAITVVLIAPRPTSSTPIFPCGARIWTPLRLMLSPFGGRTRTLTFYKAATDVPLGRNRGRLACKLLGLWGVEPEESAADARPIVCVDLNGVLDAYAGWQGPEHWDAPRPGAEAFLRALSERGFRVVVFTTRWGDDA